MNENVKFIIVDLFCGFGGTTTGYHQTDGLAKVIACVNHDPKAIESHWLNYPDVVHFEEDIRTLNLTPLKTLVKARKMQYPNAKLILWASLECTNFSKAKGGLPREADSRTLACALLRYIKRIKPDYIKIENVVEFMAWGPLDQFGKPISKRNGEEWLKWRKSICDLGYYDEWKEMNSANYGAYTSRNRLFGCFAKNGLLINWPSPTHAKKVEKADLFSNVLKPWKPVREVLKLDIEGESIFNRKKPLSDKTLERIYAGLIKYVAGGQDSFIAKYYSGRPKGKVISINGPAGTITTSDGQSLVKANFILKYNSTNKSGKVSPGHSINEPSPTVTCQGRLALVDTTFLTKYYGTGANIQSINEPCPTLRTKDTIAKVKANYIVRDFSNGSNVSSIENPLGTILPVPKANMVTAHFIVNPSYWGHASSIENPCPVIIARQDKAPLYLINAEMGMVGIEIKEDDSESMIKIKEFMLHYGISDIKMRMLMVPELLKIQGFEESYKMVGNQTDAKKFIGNSVVPVVVKEWCISMSKVI